MGAVVLGEIMPDISTANESCLKSRPLGAESGLNAFKTVTVRPLFVTLNLALKSAIPKVLEFASVYLIRKKLKSSGRSISIVEPVNIG